MHLCSPPAASVVTHKRYLIMGVIVNWQPVASQLKARRSVSADLT